MTGQSNDASSNIFKSCIVPEMGEVPVNGQMLIVLMQVDGKSNVEMIAKRVGMPTEIVIQILTTLSSRNLVEAVEKNIDALGDDFFSYLTSQLSVVAGPISQLLVEDARREIDQESVGIPKKRAAELIDLLARQIPEENQRLLFIQSMMQKLKEI